MADYETKAFTVGDVTVTASKASKDNAADRLEAVLKWLGQQISHPDQGLPGGGGKPDQGLPGGGGKPDQGLPPSGGEPPAPDQGLPGGGTSPGAPDQSLPGEALGNFLKENAKEIVAAILKGTACDPAQPK